MNYTNPNYYLNYPYNNQYIPPQQIQMPQIAQQQTLNGKIVDSAEVAKISEVPIGGYGIFPKADLSEIYIKSWNNNGTTNIVTFKPTENREEEKMVVLKSDFEKMLERIEVLEKKINSFTEERNSTKEREVVINGF